jgi:hypothetical protein
MKFEAYLHFIIEYSRNSPRFLNKLCVPLSIICSKTELTEIAILNHNVVDYTL